MQLSYAAMLSIAATEWHTGRWQLAFDSLILATRCEEVGLCLNFGSLATGIKVSKSHCD